VGIRPLPTRSDDDLWARRLSRRPLLSTLAALVCLAALGALLWGDAHTGRETTFGGLQIVPLAVAGWLLGPRIALALTAAAIGLRVAAIAIGAVAPVTGGIQSGVALVVGLLVIAAADRANARLVMERRARGVRRLTRLLDAIRALGAEGDPELAMEEILAAAAAVFTPPGRRPPRAFLATVTDGGALRVILELENAGGRPSLLGTEFPLADSPGMVRVVEDGGTVASRRNQLRREARRLAHELGIVTVAAARVRAGRRAYGVLALGFADERTFDPEELRLLQAMGHLAGIAIDAATAVSVERRHTDELRRRAEQIAGVESAKREFLLLASHELRSPLAVARGYAAMLSDGTLGKPPAAFHRPLAVLEDKLGEIGALVDDMLETARLETGNLDLDHGPVDLREVVRTAVAQVRPVVTKRHRLHVELPGKPVVVRGDTERLRRIAVNLLDNAVKYSPEGGPVRCAVEVDDGHAEMRVHDRGLGIAADAQARMFKRFGRIVTPRTSNIPGTGLGLYLCRELARAHGGDITVESTEGEGSTFTLTLPLEAAARN
jgi:signal transduction histidine kinase